MGYSLKFPVRLFANTEAYMVLQAKGRVLCVDDHSDISDLVSFILDDYVITPAFSMADAIKAATAEKFDLYIVDYYLPDGTGLELCLMLRAFDKETPILFATTASSITEEQVITAGAQGIIKKGVLFANDLRTRVSQCLSHAEPK